MADIEWQTEYSIEVTASPAYAWAYMSDVRNWHDPPAQFRLLGPFASGTQGRTEIPGQAPLQWQLRDVMPTEFYAAELSLDRATIRFEWRFDELSNERTRLSQHILLTGENASQYVDEVQRAFTSNLEAGMNKIGLAINRSYASAQNGNPGITATQ